MQRPHGAQWKRCRPTVTAPNRVRTVFFPPLPRRSRTAAACRPLLPAGPAHLKPALKGAADRLVRSVPKGRLDSLEIQFLRRGGNQLRHHRLNRIKRTGTENPLRAAQLPGQRIRRPKRLRLLKRAFYVRQRAGLRPLGRLLIFHCTAQWSGPPPDTYWHTAHNRSIQVQNFFDPHPQAI